MDEHIKQFIDGMKLNSPTTEEKLKEVETKLGISFPVQYKEFMLVSNGAGMGFAFDNRTKETSVMTLPFTSIDLEDLELCSSIFNVFLQNLYSLKD